MLNKFHDWFANQSIPIQWIIDILILLFIFWPVSIPIDIVIKWSYQFRLLLVAHHVLVIVIMVYWLHRLLNKKKNNMIKYVAGFMFNNDKSRVALILKNKPDWQKGYLNGIGGKIEPNENSLEAIHREFKEETGFTTEKELWKHYATVSDINKTYSVDFYYYVTNNDNLNKLISTTDERIFIANVDEIDLDYFEVIPNLKWLIRICLDENFRFGEITLNT